jgi:Flp pilus assembly protein TadD
LGEIETAALLSPNKEQIHIQLGAIKIEMGDSVGAKQSFTKAYELGPQFPDLAQFAIAGHFLVGESAEAKKIMLATFSTSTIDSEILNSVYVYTKNFPNLIALWKLRVSYPDAPLASFYGLAQAYYASGDLQMTVGTLQRAALARPESKEEIQTVLTELHKSVGGQ